MSFADKGAVGEIEPAFFVGYLHRVKATGTLRFDDPPIQRAIYFREGRILFSSSNAPEDQLGAILVAGGKISQTDFDAIVAGLLPKQSIAAALSQGGHVSQRDIGDAARRKVEQIVGACCAQTTGRYEFEDGVLPKGALDLKLTTEKVLVAAFDALEPSGFLIRILKSPVAVLGSGSAEPVEPDLVRLRESLDGVSALPDVAARAGLPPAATEARAAVLVVTGAATVVTSQIEEMSLPDTGETMPEVQGFMLPEEAPAFEAETIAFAPMEDSTMSIPQAAPEPEPGLGSGPDATLMMMPEPLEPPAPDSPPFPAGDATLIVGSGLDLATPPPPRSPNSSGAYRVGPARPAKPRTTTDDLNAIKELIAAPASGTVRPGADDDSEEVEEDDPKGQGKGFAALASHPVARPLGMALAVLLLAAAGWFGYSTWSAPKPAPAAAQRAAARPPAPVAAPSLTPVADGPSALAPPPAATGVPAVSPAPVRTAAVPTPTAAPAAAVAAPQPAVAGPSPARAAAPPTPAAASPAAAPAPTLSTGEAYEAMKSGRLAEAAIAFDAVARARRVQYTVQILVACVPETIAKAIQNDPSPDLFIVPATMDGRLCNRLLRGFYGSNAEASQALATLPPYYTAEGAHPRAVSIRSVLR